MCNGCVVVSEHSEDFDPLLPGEHLLFSNPGRIVATASALLRDPERLTSIRQSAWAETKALDMRSSALRLMEVADSITSHGSPPRAQRVGTTPQRPGAHPMVPEPPQPASELPSLAHWAEALAAPVGRERAAALTVGSARVGGIVTTEILKSPGATRRVVALIPDVKRDARQASRTLESLAAQGAAVAAWIGGPEALPTATPTETEGAGATLNALLGATESELVLVVEPGQGAFLQLRTEAPSGARRSAGGGCRLRIHGRSDRWRALERAPVGG